MEEKSLAKNSIYNIIYKTLNVIFPLLTSMYVSRVLLSDGIGQVASAKNLVTYFTLLAASGLPIYGTKKIAEVRNNSRSINKVFSELYIINFISTSFYTFSYYLIIVIFNQFKTERLLYLIVGLQIVLNVFNVDWFYQGIEEYRYIMVRSFLIKIICFVLIIFFVREQKDYLIYAMISTLGVALNYIFNIYHLKNKVKFVISGLSIFPHLKFILTLFVSSIAIEIYTLADITMLTAMTTRSNVGYYSNAINGVKTIKESIVAICGVFLPRLSYYYANNEIDKFKKLSIQGLKILSYFSIPAAIGVFILADKIILILFGENFILSINTVRILSISIITVSLNNFIGYQIFVVIGKEKYMVFISFFGAIFNVIANTLFIPLYAHNGAAFASALTELIVCIMYCYLFFKIFSVENLLNHFVSIIISIIGMTLLVVLIQNFNMPILLNCIISSFFGCITYVCIGFMFKNEISFLLFEKIKNILKKYEIKNKSF